MTNQPNPSPRQQPSQEIALLDPAPEYSSDNQRSHGMTLYGLWVGVGWLVEQARGMVEEFLPDLDAVMRKTKGAPAQPHTLDEPAESSTPVASALTADQELQPLADETVQRPQEIATPPSPNTAQLVTDFDSEDAVTSSATNTDVTVGQAAAGSAGAAGGSSAGGGQGGGSGSAGGKLTHQFTVGQPVLEFEFPDFFSNTETYEFQYATGALSDVFDFEWAEYEFNNVTFVAGDYYDIQLATSFGSFDAVAGDASAGAADVFEVTFGSVLNSTMSDYDLVVIEQDLTEINIIAQHNFSVSDSVDEVVSGLDVQANQAAIFDVASQSGSQLAMGDVINLASVEQINFAESVQTAMQFNDATIFDGSGLQDLPDEASFPPGAGHEDLMSAINADPDFSVLYVTGSYYEVNVVEQVSMLATPHGGNTQLNSAMINDFEGVAEFQVVGGDTYNVDSIEQTNYLSQADVPPPFASGDFLPGKPASAADAAAAGPSGNLLASIIPGQTHLGGQSVSQLANNQNPGSQNPGSQNSASQNSGNQNSGNQHVGHQPVGNQHMGNQQFGANAVSDNLMGDIMAV